MSKGGWLSAPSFLLNVRMSILRKTLYVQLWLSPLRLVGTQVFSKSSFWNGLSVLSKMDPSDTCFSRKTLV